MKLDTLTQSLELFLRDLTLGYSSGLESIYDVIGNWQEHWPPVSAQDLSSKLENCLQSQRSRSLWQGHAYYPKEAILKLADFSPDLMLAAFARLFSEDLPLDERFRHFVYYCDEALGEWQRTQPLKALDIHYQSDYRAPSLYTCARLPATHAYYEAELYRKSMELLSVKDIGPLPDPARFHKSVQVILKFMRKSSGFEEALQHPRASIKRGDHALLVSEYFRHFCGWKQA